MWLWSSVEFQPRNTRRLESRSTMGLQWVQSVRRRLAGHLQNQSLECITETIHKHSGSVYMDPLRDAVARQTPCLAVPSMVLPPGYAYATAQPDGRNVLVYRDKANNLSGFLNACRHRNMPLLPNNKLVKTNLLVCPYHAWSYKPTSGQLRGVPVEGTAFPCLDKNQHSLISLPVHERVGAIWVGEENGVRYKFDELSSDLSPLLELEPSNDRLVGYREWEVKANWQLVVETFLESYHVKFLHRNTLSKVAHSHLMVTDLRDDSANYRMTVPLKNFDSTTTNEMDAESFLSQTTTTSLVFPSSAVSLFKRFALFLSVFPTSNGEKSIVRAWGTDHRYGNSDVSGFDKGDQARDLESVLKAIEEDWEAAEAIQTNISPDREFTHGTLEGCNAKFLQNVGKAAKALQ